MTYTVMLWRSKRELRVVSNEVSVKDPVLAASEQLKIDTEFEFLPEHQHNPPQFDTPEQGWRYIRTEYPYLQP